MGHQISPWKSTNVVEADPRWCFRDGVLNRTGFGVMRPERDNLAEGGQ